MGNENARFSRRNFLKGTGVAALAMAGGALVGCSSGNDASASGVSSESTAVDGSSIAWTKEADVVVCGYGAAGASCAIEAAANGASVIILEKAALPGGSMARCGGAIMGAPTKIQKALGIEDSADALFDWIMTCTDGTCSKDIARAYADVAGPNVDWLDALAEEYLGQPCFEVAMAEANVGTADGGHNGAVGGCLDATGCEYEKFGVKLEEAVPRTHWAKAAPDNTANSGPELSSPTRFLTITRLTQQTYRRTQTMRKRSAEEKQKQLERFLMNVAEAADAALWEYWREKEAEHRRFATEYVTRRGLIPQQ